MPVFDYVLQVEQYVDTARCKYGCCANLGVFPTLYQLVEVKRAPSKLLPACEVNVFFGRPFVVSLNHCAKGANKRVFGGAPTFRPGLARSTPLVSAALKRSLSDVNGQTKVGEEPRFLDMVKLNLEKAAQYTDLSPGMVNQILSCNSVLRVAFPIERVSILRSS